MRLAYKAYDNSGADVCGTIECPNAASAAEMLRQKGLYLAEASEWSEGTVEQDEKRRVRKHISGKRTKNVAVFARQLGVLLSSGTPVIEAMEALEQQAKQGPWRDTVLALRGEVERGTSLSQAMQDHPSYFDPICYSLVDAGESSGHLPEMLKRLTTLKEKQLQIRSSVISAMVYPTLLVFVGMAIFGMLMVYVIPKFTMLFDTLDVPLPASTKALVAVSGVFRSYWWVGLSLLLGSGAGVFLYMRTPEGERLRDTVVLKLPYIGNLVKSVVTARIVRILGVLIDGHVQVLDAMALVRNIAGNTHYEDLLAKAENYVTKGEPISLAFSDTNLISPSVHAGMRSGEQSGQLSRLMLNIADFLDDENDIVIRSLTSILEPVILIVMGILVALISISMFMPLFDLTSVAQG